MSLEVKPWLGEVYELQFKSLYSFSFYPSVDHAIPQLRNHSHDHLLYFGLEYPGSPRTSFDGDLQFVNTPRQSFSFRSFALQGRYLWLDDIVGDRVSFVTGFHLRYTSQKSLRDVSCPYHGDVDFEGHFAIGKEFDNVQDWRLRYWGFAALGIANRGSPWMRAIVSVEGNYKDLHKWAIYSIGNHGFGRKTILDPYAFNGYGMIRAKFIDLGCSYGYQIGCTGTVRIGYEKRVLARRCPQRMNTFYISILIPFSA